MVKQFYFILDMIKSSVVPNRFGISIINGSHMLELKNTGFIHLALCLKIC